MLVGGSCPQIFHTFKASTTVPSLRLFFFFFGMCPHTLAPLVILDFLDGLDFTYSDWRLRKNDKTICDSKILSSFL